MWADDRRHHRCLRHRTHCCCRHRRRRRQQIFIKTEFIHVPIRILIANLSSICLRRYSSIKYRTVQLFRL